MRRMVCFVLIESLTGLTLEECMILGDKNLIVEFTYYFRAWTS